MDVLRTDDEREDFENKVRSDASSEALDPKDYTVTEIEEMDLTREQLQSLYDQEKVSDKPRTSLLTYLEEQLGKKPV